MKPHDDLIPTRKSLLARLKDWRDHEGWEVFYETYWRLIYKASVKAGLSDAEAQDVVQDTVLAVAKQMGTFKYDPALGSFKGWLLQLTRWRIADQLRKRRGGPLPAEAGDDDTARTDLVARIPDPGSLELDSVWEEEWQENLKKAALDRVKRKVSAKHYQLFDLYVIKQWSVEDIVSTLGVTEHQVYQAKSRISALAQKEVKHLERSWI